MKLYRNSTWTSIVEMWLLSSGPCASPHLPHVLRASRAFSTTQPVLTNTVPPESPSYVRLSNPPQSEEIKPPRVRGHLPVPRKIFSRLEGDRKIRPEYMQCTAPEPTNRAAPSSAARQWKQRIAETRRCNLKESLQELWERRSKGEKIRQHHKSNKFEEHRRASQASEREDDRLTRTTVLESLLDTKVYPDPERFARAARSRSKLQAQEGAKREARRHALTELYISASNFIVQESDLKWEVDRVFQDDHFTKQNRGVNRYGASTNIWGSHGKPPTLATMLEATSGNLPRMNNFYESEHDRSVKRLMKIAETLTGGKI